MRDTDAINEALRRIGLALLVLSAALGCTPRGLRSSTPTRSAQACPDNTTRACLAGVSCTWDRGRDCERCQCAEPAFVPLGR